MSKPRRKYNQARTLQKLSDATLKGYAVAFVTGHGDYNKFIDLKKMIVRNPSQAEYDHISKVEHHWCMHMAVLSRKENGSEHMDYVVQRSVQRVLHSDLVSHFNDVHQELIKSVNQSRLVAAAWVACPGGNELTEHQLMTIFGKMQGWNPQVHDEYTTTTENIPAARSGEHSGQSQLEDS